MNVMDVFSGSGAMSLGLEMAGMRTIAFCENDPFCRRWLRHAWPGVPVFGDIRRLTRGRLELVLGEKAGAIDVLAAGVPCQPASTAGLRRGADDDRWLWPEALRLVEEIRPRWCIFENPTGILSLVQYPGSPPVDGEGYALAEEGDVYVREGPGVAEEIMATLERLGYDVQPVVIPACGVQGMHERYRVWIVAHGYSARPARGPAPEHEKGDATDFGGQDVADALGARPAPGPTPEHEKGDAADPGGQDVADADRPGLEERRRLAGHDEAQQPAIERGGRTSAQDVADSSRELRHGGGECWRGGRQPSDGGWRKIEPRLGLSVDDPAALVARHGVLPVAPYGAERYPWEEPQLVAGKTPFRRQRLQALGNAVFWPVVFKLGKAIMQVENEMRGKG